VWNGYILNPSSNDKLCQHLNKYDCRMHCIFVFSDITSYINKYPHPHDHNCDFIVPYVLELKHNYSLITKLIGDKSEVKGYICGACDKDMSIQTNRHCMNIYYIELSCGHLIHSCCLRTIVCYDIFMQLSIYCILCREKIINIPSDKIIERRKKYKLSR
jgi:hypothetical protein